jgi:uncharacterized protein (DUF2336 family)
LHYDFGKSARILPNLQRYPVVAASAALLSELDAIDGWPPERWAEILHRVTKFFLSHADGLTTHQIALFDDVFVRLIDRADRQLLAQISRQLSEAKCSLPQATRRLALDEDESVSLPVLKSGNVAPAFLLDVAQSSGSKQRLAIACRNDVAPAVSEALVRCGDAAVHHALAENKGAKLSEGSWARLIQLGESDQRLAEKLGRRRDIPLPLRRRLHAKLEDTRMRALNAMPGAMRDQIEHTIATTDTTPILGSDPADYASALVNIAELGRKGRLNDSTINRFAINRDYTNVVAALAFLTGSPIEVIQRLIVSDSVEGVVLACKASRLDWATANSIVKHRPGHLPIPAEELEKAKKTFETFSLSAAQRTVRF